MSFKIKTILVCQTTLILLLTSALLFLGGDLKQANKMTLDQSNYCIRYTSDIIASSRLDLIREQDLHSRNLDKANSTISNLVHMYNVLAGKYNKSTGGYNYSPLNEYSYRVVRN
jgi:hypothetical protein